jgi:5'(3')-deoxyribonucleotidase
MSKPVILCDVDGVLIDFVSGVRAGFKALGAPDFTPEQITDPDMTKAFNQAQLLAFEQLRSERGFCSTLQFYPGAQEFVESLKRLGDVYMVTAPWDPDTWCHERKEQLMEVVRPEKIIFAHSSAKRLVLGDVLIEDNAKNLDEWAFTIGNTPILVDRPWNRSAHLNKGRYRVTNYHEALLQISENL